MRANKGRVSDAVPTEVFGGDTGRIDNRALAGLKRQAKGTVDDAVPCEEIAGETTRLDATAIHSLLEKSEGVKPMAAGTPGEGFPKLEEGEPEITVAGGEDQGDEEAVAATSDSMTEEPAPRASRFGAFMIGGVLSMLVLAAWYCATQL